MRHRQRTWPSHDGQVRHGPQNANSSQNTSSSQNASSSQNTNGPETPRRGGQVNRRYSYGFLVPAVVVFTLFFVLPAAVGLWLSFTDATVLSPETHFVGLDVYRMLFGDDFEGLRNATWNQTIFAALDTIAKTGIGTALAFLLDRAFRGRSVVRALVYLPIMFSPVVVGILFTFILQPEGLLNTLLTRAGLGVLANDWLGSFDLALYSVVGIDTWLGVGWTVVIVLAALQAIPQDVIEAAMVDGAAGWKLTWQIKVPFILHAVNLALVLTLVSGMKAFDVFYATTRGGPGGATEVMATYAAKALSSGSLAYPAAVTVVQFVIVSVMAVAANVYLRRREAHAE